MIFGYEYRWVDEENYLRFFRKPNLLEFLSFSKIEGTSRVKMAKTIEY